MTTDSTSSTPKQGVRLSRWDFLILPFLSLLTILAMAGLSEIAARVLSPEAHFDSCRIHKDVGGDRYTPNCTSRTKLFGGPWVVNQYNDCGYRNLSSCAPKQPGTIRIAVLGTSAATGFMVPYDETVWGILETKLTRQCRRPIQVQNLAVFGTGANLIEQAHRIDEALALKPDLIILMASGGDLPGVEDWRPAGTPKPEVTAAVQQMGLPARILDKIKSAIRHSAAMTAFRYFLYQNDQAYLKIYMTTQGEDMGYMRERFSPLWEKRLQIFDSLLVDMAEKANRQGVPLVLAPSIFRAQVLLFHEQGEFPGVDAYAFDKAMQEIAKKRGFIKFDVSPEFQQVQHTNQIYYVADGHFSPRGHEVFARSVLRELRERKLLEPAGCVLTEDTN